MSSNMALATGSLVLLFTVFSLIREIRLRRALHRLLTLWRNRHAENNSRRPDVAGSRHDRSDRL